MAYPPQHSPLLGDPTSPASPAFRESPNSPYLYSDDGASNNQFSSMDGQSTLGLHARQRSYTDDKEEAGADSPALGAAAGDAARGTGGGFWSRLSQRAKRLLIVGIILLLIILIIVIAVPTAITRSNAKSNAAVAAEGDDSNSSSRASISRASPSATHSSSSTSAAPTPSGRPAWGGDGSTVYTEDGSTFVYQNSFGEFGFSVCHSSFCCTANATFFREKAASGTPSPSTTRRALKASLLRSTRLGTTTPTRSAESTSEGELRLLFFLSSLPALRFRRPLTSPSPFPLLPRSPPSLLALSHLSPSPHLASTNRWLTIEPFIVPGLFEPFNEAGINHDATVVDEWTLCEALGSNMSAVITEHYDTFIVSCHL